MSEHYSHLLIPEHPDFAPSPTQMTSFLEGLLRSSSAPKEAKIRVGKLTGKLRTAKNAFTGEVMSTVPVREFGQAGSLDAIASGLDGLEDYILSLSGKGPADRPPFKLYLPADRAWRSEVRTEYFYEINFNLRESSMPLNDWMAPQSKDCVEGVFRNPWNNAVIKVPNAAYTRFWIEFVFGAWLVPKIEGSLDLLPRETTSMATDSFGIRFAQGCRFG